MSVYFIRLSGTPYVKVGFSDEWQRRIRDLQSTNPHQIDVALVAEGGRAEEQACHLLLAGRGTPLREWFHHSHEFDALIDRIGALGGDIRAAIAELNNERKRRAERAATVSRICVLSKIAAFDAAVAANI